MSQITLRDVDNRDDAGAPYEFTGTPEQIVGYLDGPLRGDLLDKGADWLAEAIRLVTLGDLDGANALLNANAAVYLRSEA